MSLYLSVIQWAHQKFGKSKLFICLLVRFSTLFQKAALCDVTNGSGMSMMPLMGCRQALVYWSPERSAFSMSVSLSIPTAPRSISWRNRQALSCWLRILKSQTKEINSSSLFLVFSNLGFIHINEPVISLKIQSEVSKRIDIKKGSNHPESSDRISTCSVKGSVKPCRGFVSQLATNGRHFNWDCCQHLKQQRVYLAINRSVAPMGVGVFWPREKTSGTGLETEQGRDD